MSPTKLLLGSAGALGTSLGGWQLFEGGVPSSHSKLLSEGYQWSLPASNYEHPITLPTVNPLGFKTNGCFEHFFGTDKEVKFEPKSDQKAPDADANDDFSGDSLTGKVEACFLGDVKYRKLTKQDAISLKTELTLRKGNHGLAVWSALTNLGAAGTAPVDYIYVVRLSKSGSNWEIKKGYQFTTSVNLGAGGYLGLKIRFKGQEIFASENAQLCTKKTASGASTNASCVDWDSQGVSHLKWFEIFEGSGSGPQQLFGQLVIEDTKVEEERKYAFWIPENRDWNDESMGWSGLRAVYDTSANAWKSTTSYSLSIKDPLTKWLKPFKEAKGTWNDGNTWCWNQANSRGGAPSNLFKELCYKK